MRDLVLLFSALADENRLRLLHLMEKEEICVCYLQGVLKTNQPKISRHLAYLKRAGLVESRKEGKWMHYRLRKLEPVLQNILSETLACLREHSQTQTDQRRLKKICCTPSRFGFSSPPK